MNLQRRDFIRMSGVGMLSAMVGARGVGANPAISGHTRPDVLVLMTDQWNPYNFGYERDPDVHTPNLDALAAQSLNFTRCYTNCPICMPARGCFISGLYPHNTGLWGNTTAYYLPPGLATLFSDVRQAGYTTAQIGKFHWLAGDGFRREFDSLANYYRAVGLDHAEPIDPPYSSATNPAGAYQDYLRSFGEYDEFRADMLQRLHGNSYEPRPGTVPPERHNDWYTADRAIRYLSAQPKDQPYFLVTSFPGPHVPLDGNGRFLELYDPAKVTLAPNVRAGAEGKSRFTPDEVRRMRANYLAKITLIDECIGRIIRTLKERATWDNTMVIFTADHGEMMGAHGRVGKGAFHEESARIPMLVRLPGGGGRPGQRSPALVQLSDVYATVVEAINGKMNPLSFSRSMLPVVRSETEQIRDTGFSEFSRGGDLEFMVSDSRYKWFRQFGQDRLYDLQEDPYEMNDLAASAAHRGICDTSLDRLRDFLMTTQINHSTGYQSLAARVRSGKPVTPQL